MKTPAFMRWVDWLLSISGHHDSVVGLVRQKTTVAAEITFSAVLIAIEFWIRIKFKERN